MHIKKSNNMKKHPSKKSQIRGSKKIRYTFLQLLEYETFFCESVNNVDIESILSRLSRQDVVNFAITLNNNYANQSIEKLHLFFNPSHIYNRNLILQRLKELNNMPYIICTSKTSLEILRIAFSLNPCTDSLIRDSERDELDLFKVMLVINQRLMQYKIDQSNLNTPQLLFMGAHINSLTDNVSDQYKKNRFIYQFNMSYQFFKWFSTNNKLKPLYETFLHKYGINSWKDYMKTIFFTSILLIKENKHAYINGNLNIDINGLINKNVLEKLVLPYDEVVNYGTNSSSNRNTNDDYRCFRGRPFIKMPNGNYFPIYWEFTVDKFYNSLYFDLKETNTHKNINTDYIFTKEFCEEHMFNNLISQSYNPFKAIGFTEDMCKKRYKEKEGEQGPPDFIIKDHNSIILFECKDIRIPGNIIETKNFEKIIEVYSNKLHEKTFQGSFESRKKSNNINGNKIGITQLTEHIKNIRTQRFHWIDCKHNINIYPVLVLSDHKNLVSGFPEIATKWYYNSLKSSSPNNNKRNRPLIVMSFITLFKYSCLFKAHGFKYYFEDYFKHLTTLGITTFDDYMEQHHYNILISATKIMNDILK